MNRKRIIYVIIAIITIVFIPILLLTKSKYGFLSDEQSYSLLGYFGSIVGSFLALFGVYITIKENRKDKKEEFDITYQSGSLDIQVGSGKAIIGGRGAYADQSGTLTLPANSTIYLCLRADLTQTQGQELMLYPNTSSEIAQDNLNDGTNGVRDLLLAIVETNADGVVSVEDKRTIKAKAGGIEYVVLETWED